MFITFGHTPPPAEEGYGGALRFRIWLFLIFLFIIESQSGIIL
jgi:hypothetical protein